MTKAKKKKRAPYIGVNLPEILRDYVEEKAKKMSDEYKTYTITDVVIDALKFKKAFDEQNESKNG